MLRITNLSGFGAGQSGPAPLTTLSFLGSAISSTATVTVPATVQAGDLLVLFNQGVSASTPTTAVPAGFTLVANTSDATNRIIESYKIAVGTEAGTSISGMTSTGHGYILACFRGDVPIKAVTAASVNAQTTSATPTAQTITSGSGVAPLVAIGTWCVQIGSVSVRGFSPAADAEITAAVQEFLKYKIYNASPANIAVTMADDGADNSLHSFYLACS